MNGFFSLYCVAGQTPTFQLFLPHQSIIVPSTRTVLHINEISVLVSRSWAEWVAEWTRLCTDSQISGNSPVGDAGL